MEASKIKAFIGVSLAVIFITGFGIIMLCYDNAKIRQIEEPTQVALEAVVNASASDGEIPREDMYINGKLDINKADAAELETLPEIGPVLAKRIITYRQTQPFKVTRDLKKVSGIGDAIYSSVLEYICVGDFE